MTRSFVFRVYTLLCFAIVVFVPEHPSAQEKRTSITIGIDTKITERLTPFVFVDGALAGVVGGVISLPTATKSTIEIGLPQAKQPLYSFVLGPDQFNSNSANIVMTNYRYKSDKFDPIWSDVSLAPNTTTKVVLKFDFKGPILINLPANAYKSYLDINQKLNIKPFGKDWLETIPAANDRSASTLIDHQTVAMAGPKNWSGSYSQNTTVGFWSKKKSGLLPPAYGSKTWNITSVPAGATIYSVRGKIGLTDSNVELPNLGETYVVLTKSGFYDIPQKKCDYTNSKTTIRLKCVLKKR